MNAVAIDADELPPVMAGVESTTSNKYQAMAPLPDRRLVSFADADRYEYREVLLKDPTGQRPEEIINLDWQGAGSEIWTLHLGPDKKIYGSSMLPERFFRSDLDGRNIVDFGQCSIANGEGYSIANYDGKIAILSYPGTRLSLYDPKLPYQFGTGPGSNPLDVGRLNDISTRPHVTLTAPDGKLWVGSALDYGLYSGTLSWFNPKTALRETYHNILEDCTPSDLECIPVMDRLLIGFITESGTGAPVRVKQGAFAIRDPVGEKADYLGDFGYDELAGVCSLLPAMGCFMQSVGAIHACWFTMTPKRHRPSYYSSIRRTKPWSIRRQFPIRLEHCLSSRATFSEGIPMVRFTVRPARRFFGSNRAPLTSHLCTKSPKAKRP